MIEDCYGALRATVPTSKRGCLLSRMDFFLPDVAETQVVQGVDLWRQRMAHGMALAQR
jgi:phage tail protein X